ncbi:glutamate receptor ionotropic, kainate 3-like protein [Plakobranchus ocellatus]|uniref:Glutamate receptor ionotropic, kainate 3-like protein n=1 Tax=Plakobranchus ocellatus TaxID=259542 RepID=A0AAV4AY07_9GAST|nr:glutamate receptor ionotropic, kainate 3-like protein [Plakobranchus ocellatus]
MLSGIILVVYLLSGLPAAASHLRIGVLETSVPIVESLLDFDNLTDTITLVPLNTGNGSSSLETINEIYDEAAAQNVHALLGPFDGAFDLVAKSLSIPYLCTTQALPQQIHGNTFEMLPNSRWVAQAMFDLIQVFQRDKIAFFHDDDSGVPILEQLVTRRTLTVRPWRLPVHTERGLMNKALIEMRRMGVQIVILALSKSNVELMLNEALQLAMLTTPQTQWVLYDPALESKSVFAKYNQVDVNFTVLSLMEFNDSLTADPQLNLEKLLTSDALQLLQSACSAVSAPALTNSSLDRNNSRSQLIHAIEMSQDIGHTGLLAFDQYKQRTNLTLTLTSVLGSRSFQRGIWFSHPPDLVPSLNLNTAVFPVNPSTPFPLRGRRVKVVTILESPFTMFKKDHQFRKGNDRFEGYSVDLLDEISQMLNFEYELYLVHDGKFGSQLPSGEWNGMIGELLAGNATMSVAPLSINANREKAVDFTKPFMTRYISVIMRIPQFKTSYFQFLNPFSPHVWLITMVAFVVVSGVLYFLEKIGRSMSPEAGDLPTVTLRESFWFIFGSLVQGQTDIKYGTIKDTGVTNFFENTNIDYFSKMWAHMSEIEPDSMVENRTEALRKVREESYAFFWDTTVNRYQTINDCNLMEIGPPFDPKGFGIGVPPGASYLDQLSMAILKLSDISRLQSLETKWWDNGNCPDLGSSADETSSLQLENVSGVFFIVIGGIVLASIVCMAKFCFPNLFRVPEFMKQRSLTGLISSKRQKVADDGVDAERL